MEYWSYKVENLCTRTQWRRKKQIKPTLKTQLAKGKFVVKLVGELTGATMHPSGIKPHAYFIVLQGLNFRKNC